MCVCVCVWLEGPVCGELIAQTLIMWPVAVMECDSNVLCSGSLSFQPAKPIKHTLPCSPTTLHCFALHHYPSLLPPPCHTSPSIPTYSTHGLCTRLLSISSSTTSPTSILPRCLCFWLLFPDVHITLESSTCAYPPLEHLSPPTTNACLLVALQ